MRKLLPMAGNGIPLQATAEPDALIKTAASASSLNRNDVVAEVLFEFWATENCTFDGKLYAATSHPLAAQPKLEVVVEQVKDDHRFATKEPHRFANGDGPFYVVGDSKPYWVAVTGAKTFALVDALDALMTTGKRSIPQSAIERGSAVLSVDSSAPAGAPANVYGPSMGPQRLAWSPVTTIVGDLGPSFGIELIARHTPRRLAYALVGTPSTPKSQVYGAMWPLRES